MMVFWFSTLLIGLSFALSLLVMAIRDLWRLQRLIPKVIEDPTRKHLSPQMLASASPLIKKLYGGLFDLIEMLRQASQQQRIRSFDMQRLLDSMREGVLAVSTGGKVLYYNEAFVRMLDLPQAKLQEPLYLSAMPLPAEIRALIRERDFGDTGKESTLALGSETTRRYYWCKTSPLENWHRERIGMLLVVNDVTRTKLDEIARREFTANVSHQLRTPLTMIKGYIETLLDEDLSESHRSYLQVVEKHSNQLHHVIDELLSLSKLNDPSVQLDLEPASLTSIITEALKSASTVSENQGVPVSYNNQIVGDDHILSNSVLLSQAIFNLLENAIKFSPRGTSVSLNVYTEGKELVIAVEDHGPGIEASERTKIFERFYRGPETSGKTKGSGLGLAIVKHIVRAHHGRIHVDSPSTHRGSVFVLKIPRAC